MIFPDNITIAEITHITELDYKPNSKSKMEIRPWYGIVFSLGGELFYSHNSKKIKLFGNRVVFIPKNSSYEVLYTKSGGFGVINFLTVQDLPGDEFMITEEKNTDVIKNEFLTMYDRILKGQNPTSYNNLSSLYKILSHLTEDYSKKELPPVLAGALDYIESNLDSPSLSNTGIANYLSISEVYLRKLFSKNLSQSVNQYIQGKRIEKATKLLTNGAESVSEIAEKCGYANIYYFCSAFKKITGATPTEYRKKNVADLF